MLLFCSDFIDMATANSVMIVHYYLDCLRVERKGAVKTPFKGLRKVQQLTPVSCSGVAGDCHSYLHAIIVHDSLALTKATLSRFIIFLNIHIATESTNNGK